MRAAVIVGVPRMLVLPGGANRGLRVNDVLSNDSHGALFVPAVGCGAKKTRHTNTDTRQTTRHAKTSHVLQPWSVRRHVACGRLIDDGLRCLVTTLLYSGGLGLEDVMDVEHRATSTQPWVNALSGEPSFDCRGRQRAAFGNDAGYLFYGRDIQSFWRVRRRRAGASIER